MEFSSSKYVTIIVGLLYKSTYHLAWSGATPGLAYGIAFIKRNEYINIVWYTSSELMDWFYLRRM